MKICSETSNLVKTGKTYQALCM